MSGTPWLATLGLIHTLGDQASERLPHTLDGSFDAPPALVWMVPLPGPPVKSAVHTELGAPLISGDFIYTGYAGVDALLILDRRNGALQRKIPTAAPVQAQPVVFKNLLLFSDVAGATHAVDLTSGKVVWTHAGSSPVLASPTIEGDRVLVSNVGNVVTALDIGSGELLWRHAQRLDPGRSAELELYGSPSPLVFNEEVVAGFSDGTLAGLDFDSGEVLWQRRVGEGQYPDLLGTAVVIGDDLVVAGYTEPLVSIDGKTHNIRWRLDVGGAQSALPGGGTGPKPDGTLGGAGPHRFVYHGGIDGILRCVDGETSDLVWKWDSKAKTALTKPIATEAGLLVGAAGGGLYLVDPVDGRKRWSWMPGYHLSGVTAKPHVSGRQAVVITNAGNIASFVVPEPEPAWVHGAGVFDRVDGFKARGDGR